MQKQTTKALAECVLLCSLNCLRTTTTNRPKGGYENRRRSKSDVSLSRPPKRLVANNKTAGGTATEHCPAKGAQGSKEHRLRNAHCTSGSLLMTPLVFVPLEIPLPSSLPLPLSLANFQRRKSAADRVINIRFLFLLYASRISWVPCFAEYVPMTTPFTQSSMIMFRHDPIRS